MTALPIVAVGLSVLGVAALYALHHLRTQPKRRAAATLIFWQQAARPQQTRVPWSRRFTHRKTFAMLAAIVLLMGAAMLADAWQTSTASRQDVIVIDSGETMARDDEGTTLLSKAVDQATADLPNYSSNVRLISAGPWPTQLSAENDRHVATAYRLRSLQPQDGASLASLALRSAGDLVGTDGRIHWYTLLDRLPEELPPALAERVVIHTVKSPVTPKIVGVTFEPTEGQPGSGTLVVRVGGRPDGQVSVRAAIEGRSEATEVATLGQARFSNVIADGSMVSLTIAGKISRWPVRYRLPDLRPVRFQIAANVPRSLRLALLTFGTAADDGDVFVGSDGDTVPTNAKAAIVVASDGEATRPGSLLELSNDVTSNGITLEGATTGVGPVLTTIERSFIRSADATLAGLGTRARTPTLRVSVALLDDNAGLPRAGAFPVLVRRWYDALVARGETPAAVPLTRVAQDPLWQGPGDTAGVRVEAVEDDVALPTHIEPRPPAVARNSMHWADLLMVVAAGLLVVESFLHVRRKIV